MRANVWRFKPVDRLNKYKAVPLSLARFQLTGLSFATAPIELNYKTILLTGKENLQFCRFLTDLYFGFDEEFIRASQIFRKYDYVCPIVVCRAPRN